MSSDPRLRDFLKLTWQLLSHDSERKVKKMGSVRPAVLRVAHSQLSDEEAADQIRSDVQADPRAAKATLDYITKAHNHGPGYMTDRARRLLLAVMHDTSPAPISSHEVALFERERTLGWQALEDAFHELAGIVPELSDVARERAEANLRDDTTAALKSSDRIMELVGPEATHPDPLVRSPLAAQIVYRYISVLEHRRPQQDLHRSVWQWPNPDPIQRRARRLAASARGPDRRGQ